MTMSFSNQASEWKGGERKTLAWKLARVAFVLFIATGIMALFMPEAWISISKFTVQSGIWPFAGAFGCHPESEPCCLEGYNLSAMTDKWDDASPQVICRYYRYPLKGLFIITAILLFICAAIAHAYEARKPRREDKDAEKGVSRTGASSS